jgi:hypothetical protein
MKWHRNNNRFTLLQLLLVVLMIYIYCHSSGGNLLLYPFIKRVVRLTVIIIEEIPPSTAYKILSNILLVRLTPYVKLLGIISVGSVVIDLLSIRFSTIARF